MHIFIEELPQGAPNECFGPWSISSIASISRTCHLTTVGRWMHYLGYTYDRAKKSFYVDGHERPDVVEERKNFCKISYRNWSQGAKDGFKLLEDELDALPDLINTGQDQEQRMLLLEKEC
jgi:hypothetical protein